MYVRYDVSVIPLCVTLGDRLCRDGVDVAPEELFSYVEETEKLPGITLSLVSWLVISIGFPCMLKISENIL